MVRVRYQRGYLICGSAIGGVDLIVGSSFGGTENPPVSASVAKPSFNEARNRQPEQAITIADLIDHYSATELAADAADGGKSHATRTVYRESLTR
jgi:hypothetical protein